MSVRSIHKSILPVVNFTTYIIKKVNNSKLLFLIFLLNAISLNLIFAIKSLN